MKLFNFFKILIIEAGILLNLNSSKLNKGAASGLMGAFQVGSGGLAGFLIIYFGGAENFNICLYALFIMSGVSIISSYLILQIKRISMM